MDLFFFIASGMVLCFRLVTKTMLIIHSRFSYSPTILAQSHGLLFLTLPLQWIDWGEYKRLGEDITGDPTNQRDVPHHIIVLSNRCLATFHLGTGWASVYTWGVLSICLGIAYFLSLLPLHLNSFYFNPQVFLFPYLTWGRAERASGCVVLSCLPKLSLVGRVRHCAERPLTLKWT